MIRSRAIVALFAGTAFGLARMGPGCEPTLDEVVTDYRERVGLVHAADCGSVSLDCTSSVDTPPGPVACLLEAAGACNPAELRVVRHTIEGDPIESAYLVVPDGDGACRVARFLDTMRDRWGPRRIVRHDCEAVRAEAGCPWLDATGCGQAIVEAD